jgi:hypothetical protein
MAKATAFAASNSATAFAASNSVVVSIHFGLFEHGFEALANTMGDTLIRIVY